MLPKTGSSSEVRIDLSARRSRVVHIPTGKPQAVAYEKRADTIYFSTFVHLEAS